MGNMGRRTVPILPSPISRLVRHISTARANDEGGYETEPRSSNVAPEVESVLMGQSRN